MNDIMPVVTYLNQLTTEKVPSVYLKDLSIFMQSFCRFHLCDIATQLQDNESLNVVRRTFERDLVTFKTNCMKTGLEKIHKDMKEIYLPDLQMKIDKFSEENHSLTGNAYHKGLHEYSFNQFIGMIK